MRRYRNGIETIVYPAIIKKKDEQIFIDEKFYQNTATSVDSNVADQPQRSFWQKFLNVFHNAFNYVSGLFTESTDVRVDESAKSAEELIVVDQYANPEIRSGLEQCLSLSEDRGACYASLCGVLDVGYICAEHIVYEATLLGNLETGITVIQEINDTPAFGLTDSDTFGRHQLAHIVGRSAVKNHGRTIGIFVQCPITFDYGCYHGFFEAMVQLVSSPAEALMIICSPTEDTIHNDTANCYHGGGHGIMMDASYNLDEALAVCDELEPSDIGNCYGGVFMESGKGFTGGRVPTENDIYYQNDNLLAPCDSLEKKYRHACYSSHFMYYVQVVVPVSVEKMLTICQGAGDDFKSCLLGAMRLFIEGSQDTVLRNSSLDFTGDVVEKTIFSVTNYRQNTSVPATCFLSTTIWKI